VRSNLNALKMTSREIPMSAAIAAHRVECPAKVRPNGEPGRSPCDKSRLDESSSGDPSASCSPAELASVSPTKAIPLKLWLAAQCSLGWPADSVSTNVPRQGSSPSRTYCQRSALEPTRAQIILRIAFRQMRNEIQKLSHRPPPVRRPHFAACVKLQRPLKHHA